VFGFLNFREGEMFRRSAWAVVGLLAGFCQGGVGGPASGLLIRPAEASVIYSATGTDVFNRDVSFVYTASGFITGDLTVFGTLLDSFAPGVTSVEFLPDVGAPSPIDVISISFTTGIASLIFPVGTFSELGTFASGGFNPNAELSITEPTIAAVAEPGSAAIFVSSLVALFALGRRRRRANSARPAG
jgi:hypothetical protein